MGEYLKPWRRRIGVLTLVVACLFTAGWVRSFYVRDQITYAIGQRPREMLGSVDGLLVWCSFWNYEQTDGGTKATIRWNGGSQTNNPPFNLDGPTKLGVDWKFRCPLFGTGPMTQYSNPNRWVSFVTYWSIVLPPTVLSAWLLLSKVRQPAKVGTSQGAVI